ncbi:phosphotransferase family protein [Sulfobacillus thermosulfidooxidans]|uniref:phosphotransferase family protein n=1 Tax=Sulfobacillus thermosulfidooxidans TaxID=28034 RepID=UPI0006B45F0F|nr:phosphotransferase [Sulfobacillus thermosulfidooxidans]
MESKIWGLQTKLLVEQYLTQMYPQISGQITLFSEGWDYRIYLTSSEMVIRVPKNPWSQTHLQYEMAKLHTLSLPLDIPHYIKTSGALGVYPFISGKDLRRTKPTNQVIQQLAQFLRTLHQHTYLPQKMVINHHRHRWAKRFDLLYRDTQEKIYPLLSIKEQRRTSHYFEQFLYDISQLSWPVSLIHGDLTPEHIIAENGLIKGIIDFGDMTVGDPAYDLAGIPAQWEKDELAAYAHQIDSEGHRWFYRQVKFLHTILHGLEHGHVQDVEQAIEMFRKSI